MFCVFTVFTVFYCIVDLDDTNGCCYADVLLCGIWVCDTVSVFVLSVTVFFCVYFCGSISETVLLGK